jgi:hypothetical protein
MCFLHVPSLRAGQVNAGATTLAPLSVDLNLARTSYVYGVHWTTPANNAAIDAAGSLQPGTWVQPAQNTFQLQRLLRAGGTGTGAQGTDVAIIVDIQNVPIRYVDINGGVCLDPSLNLSTNGITWLWNSGNPAEVRLIIHSIRAGARSY